MRVAPAAGYVLPAVVVNAAIQCVLVLPDPTPVLSVPFVVGSAVSGLAALATYALIVATSVAPRAEDARRLLRDRGVRFALWTVALAVVVVLGSLVLAGVPAFLVLVATPYLPLAALSSGRNPVTANLAAIGGAPLGYAVRLVVTALLGALLFLQSALTTFFVGGAAATAITMTLWGLAAWWLTRLWCGSFERSGGLASFGA